MNLYYITLDGSPCRLDRRFSGYPIAVPVSDPKKMEFVGSGNAARRRAHKIIARSVRVRAKLKGTIVDEWPGVQQLIAGTAFNIVRVSRPKEDGVSE